MKLTDANVDAMFDKCLDDHGTLVHGIMFGIHLNVKGHELEIKDLLNQLPRGFQQIGVGGGGGWSFVKACEDRDGILWTSDHLTMDKLFMLGIVAGYAKYLLPRDVWQVLPGGMPYILVMDKP